MFIAVYFCIGHYTYNILLLTLCTHALECCSSHFVCLSVCLFVCLLVADLEDGGLLALQRDSNVTLSLH